MVHSFQLDGTQLEEGFVPILRTKEVEGLRQIQEGVSPASIYTFGQAGEILVHCRILRRGGEFQIQKSIDGKHKVIGNG